MKMDRGGSSDSLDHEIGDIISSSSSATDFTSDDDLNELFMMSGQPVKRKPKSRKSSHQANEVNDDNKSLQKHILMGFVPHNTLDPARHGAPPSLNRSDINKSTQSRLPSSIYNVGCTSELGSLYDTESRLDNNMDLLFANRVSGQNPLLSENHTLLNANAQQANALSDPPFESIWEQSHPSRASSSGYENIGILGNTIGYDDGNEDDDKVPLYGPSGELMHNEVASMPIQAHSTVAALCGHLVECRTLGEAIEFIASNRDLIDNLTRIVHEAPAYRNYDIGNYQTDYTVKDSFNPEFWQDREPVMTTADGNCQYHAVSISLTGTELYTQEVRLLASLAVIDNRDWFDSVLKIIDGGTVLDLVHTIARSYSWGDATTLKAIAVAIRRRIFLYTCNIGKKDYEVVKLLSKEELLEAFIEKKYRGGTGIHTYADPLIHVPNNNYIMLFHKSEHFIAVLPTNQNPIMYEPYNPIVPTFN